jgi:hypothetical protein
LGRAEQGPDLKAICIPAYPKIAIRVTELRHPAGFLATPPGKPGGPFWNFSKQRPGIFMRLMFASRVALVTTRGDHLRWLPGPLANSLARSGVVQPQQATGRVREVALMRSADVNAQRIGEPTGRATGVRFHRWVRLEASATRIVEHHPRCTYPEPEDLDA